MDSQEKLYWRAMAEGRNSGDQQQFHSCGRKKRPGMNQNKTLNEWDKNSEFKTIQWPKEGEILQEDSATGHPKCFGRSQVREEEKNVHLDLLIC